MQWLLLIGLTPLLLFYFQRVPLLSPVANIIAVPWVSLVTVPVSLLGVALLPLTPWLAEACLALAAWSLSVLWPLLEALASWSFAQWTHTSPPLWVLFTSIIGVCWLLAPRGFPARWLGGCWLLPLAFLPVEQIAQGDFRLELLDVGQGLAAVIQTRKHTLVYDTGPKFSDDFDTGSAVIVPYLKHMGVSVVHSLVVSHGDNDHSGGAQSVYDEMQVQQVITSMPFKLEWVTTTLCDEKMQWDWDGVHFKFIHPVTATTDSAGSGKKSNNLSCVLKVSTAAASVLLTGDIEASVERQLFTKARAGKLDLKADIMSVPHHGSRSSSTVEFITQVQPQYALLSLGYANRYGFPKSDIVERYLQRNITLLDTAQHGAIRFHVSKQGAVDLLQTYRQVGQRYWHQDSVKMYANYTVRKQMSMP